MAKPKSPLLSLEAQGTVGDVLTFQKRARGTIARKKPIPRNPQSLAQMYHRWDYEDYAHLWTLLSEADKQTWRSLGARQHLTGFSTFMSDRLTFLPDIMARYRLDEVAGAIMPDTSRNSNDLTIIGASPAAGVIDGSYYWDGINDIMSCPHHASLNFSTNDFSLEAFINVPALPPNRFILVKNPWLPSSFVFLVSATHQLYLRVYHSDGTNKVSDSIAGAITPNTFVHILANAHRATVIDLFVNAQEVTYSRQEDISGITEIDNNQPLFLGRPGTPAQSVGYRDHVVLRSRCLDQDEITRHAARRFPLVNLP